MSACKQYAILDECTSAVTLEVEQTFYERATGTYTGRSMRRFDASSIDDRSLLFRTRHHALDRLTPSFALEIPQVHPAGQSRKLSFSVAQVLTDPCALPVARRGRVRVRSARLGEAPRPAGRKAEPRAEIGRGVGVGNPARGTPGRGRGAGGAKGERISCVGGRVLSDDEVLFLLLVVQREKVSAVLRLLPVLVDSGSCYSLRRWLQDVHCGGMLETLEGRSGPRRHSAVVWAAPCSLSPPTHLAQEKADLLGLSGK